MIRDRVRRSFCDTIRILEKYPVPNHPYGREKMGDRHPPIKKSKGGDEVLCEGVNRVEVIAALAAGVGS
jgi:hypothetical protein